MRKKLLLVLAFSINLIVNAQIISTETKSVNDKERTIFSLRDADLGGRLNFWADVGGATKFDIKNKSYDRVFEVYSNNIHSFVDISQPESSFAIGGKAPWPIKHKLLVYDGNSYLGGDLEVTGNVGIGVSEPKSTLDVRGQVSGYSFGWAPWDNFAHGNDENFKLNHYGISLFKEKLGSVELAPKMALSGYYGLKFFTAGKERIQIDNRGNVGIGTPSPTESLTVKAFDFSDSVKNGGINLTTNYINGNRFIEADFKLVSEDGNNARVAFSHTRFDPYSGSNNGSSHEFLNFSEITRSVGINTIQPAFGTKLHVDGTVGVGSFGQGWQTRPGLEITYSDNKPLLEGGFGKVTFKQNRHVGGVYFVKEGESGIKKQVYIGSQGENAAVLDNEFTLFNGDNIPKVKLFSNGYSYLNGGNVGIGTTSPQTKFHILTGSPFGRKTTNSTAIIEAPNSNLDLISDKGDVWGSAINFVEGDLGVNTDSWTIIRKTTEGTGDSSLNFNFGTSNNTYSNPVKVTFNSNGDVGIGTTSTGGHKLAVQGSIGAREIKVETVVWSDFVFENDYKLPSLKEVENHISKKGHLKDIPSAKEIEKNGFFLGQMDAKLLQKIEELTLYTIQQQKEIENLKKENTDNKVVIEQLSELLNRIKALEEHRK